MHAPPGQCMHAMQRGSSHLVGPQEAYIVLQLAKAAQVGQARDSYICRPQAAEQPRCSSSSSSPTLTEGKAAAPRQLASAL